jgi:argininosuccinate lyase
VKKPVWDRGEPIDAAMLAFTTGDDWLADRRLIPHELAGSRAHADGLLAAGLIAAPDHAAIQAGLAELERRWRAGQWNVEQGDEDVHSAVERGLTEIAGEAGKRLHTARSRNEQVALDVRLWLRDAVAATGAGLDALIRASGAFAERHGALPLPGYTHLRRAMPSTLGAWIGAHLRAFEEDALDLAGAKRRLAECPLGSGAGYGFPVTLARESVARALGFERPEEPVTYVQHSRGRAELAYLTALEGLALSLGKLAADVWLFGSTEFGYLTLPVELTTGSSLMPQKRNPDAVELTRAHCRALVAERASVLALLADLPSGYHRDFQLLKPPLFRAHDRAQALLALWPRLIEGLQPVEAALRAAAEDPSLRATERTLERVQRGEAFRDAYREESRKGE